MSKRERWVLPAGVKEYLPEQARHIEMLRRKVLGVFERWGYELVVPPPIEYLDSLLIANDDTLDLQTFKLTDQTSGRQLGVRADMTPQVARMDAHSLGGSGINRLCYADTVLRARPDSVGGLRMQIQFGAEVYGSDALEGDIGIVCLMLETLKTLGFDDLCLDLGHVGVFSGLIREAGLDAQQRSVLLGLLQRRSRHEIEQYLDEIAPPAGPREMLLGLVELNGDRSVCEQARERLQGAPDDVFAALDELETMADLIAKRGDVTLHYDLADPHGFHYQTGVVYAVYKEGVGRELARGGRYDDFGKVFGSARPATGFSGDLLFLSEALDKPPTSGGVFAPRPNPDGPDDTVEGLWRKVEGLRADGERVVEQLGDDDTAEGCGCDRELRLVKGEWTVCELS